MRADRGRSRAILRRIAGVAAAFGLILALGQIAEADTKGSLQAARTQLVRLKRDILEKQRTLGQLSAQAAALGQRLDDAQVRFDQITAALRQTELELQRAGREYAALNVDLDARAREVYMQGPAGGLEFLLGASSFGDLSDRLEFVDAISQADADLANGVQNLKNRLVVRRKDQERLRAQQAERLGELRDAKAALDAQFANQKEVYDQLQAERSRAEELVKRLYKDWQQELAALSGVPVSNGVFKVCPVDQPRAVYDGFGAPRYGGGYHPHAGNDIIAPGGTAIRAPFDGVARASSNGLGGLTVYVEGSQGWVYNAHLSAYSASSNGPVRSGEVVGYVGETGDTDTNHDHFEWHPNVIPSGWPSSAYGYTVIGSALNPYPLLERVC